MDRDQKKQLNIRFAILSALGMFFIVDGHLDNSYLDIGGFFPYYSFHVPLFCFISGYFYKSQSEATPYAYIKRKCLHLLFPYMLWNLAYGILSQTLLMCGFSIGSPLTLHNLFLEPFITGHQFVYNLAAWFVPALFLVESVNLLLRCSFRKLINNEFIYTIFYLGIGVVGTVLSMHGKNTGGWLTLVRTMFFLPLYQFGILYKKELEKRELQNDFVYFGTIFAIQLYLHMKGFRMTYEPAFCRGFTGPLLPYITAGTGIAFWLRISRILAPSFEKGGAISFFGSHTYAVMTHHLTVLMAIKTIFAFLAKFTSLCSDFNFEQYKSNIWYYYFPNNLPQFRVVYLLLAILVPLVLQYLWENIFGSKMRGGGREKGD